ncbi:MAG: hypothetical protein AAF570_15900 [Bacteroidota bacterium]
MKQFFFLCACLMAWTGLHGQAPEKPIPLSVGYFGPYGVRPGLKVGVRHGIKSWEAESADYKSRQLFFQPQIGTFFYPRNHFSFVLEADGGIVLKNQNTGWYTAYSVGLGYLTEFAITSVSIDLGTASQGQKTREFRGYLLTVGNFEFGKSVSERWGWFVKLTGGRRFTTRIENALFVAVEIGAIINIGK